MRKLIIAAASIAALVIPSAAMANSTMTLNPNSAAGKATAAGQNTPDSASDFDGSAMGYYNSRVTGNGSYISTQAHELGGRGAAVQATLGH
jgi:hypothetical protein